jgi:hypothetical protein
MHPKRCGCDAPSYFIECATDPDCDGYGEYVLIAMNPQFLGRMAVRYQKNVGVRHFDEGTNMRFITQSRRTRIAACDT